MARRPAGADRRPSGALLNRRKARGPRYQATKIRRRGCHLRHRGRTTPRLPTRPVPGWPHQARLSQRPDPCRSRPQARCQAQRRRVRCPDRRDPRCLPHPLAAGSRDTNPPVDAGRVSADRPAVLARRRLHRGPGEASPDATAAARCRAAHDRAASTEALADHCSVRPRSSSARAERRHARRRPQSERCGFGATASSSGS